MFPLWNVIVIFFHPIMNDVYVPSFLVPPNWIRPPSDVSVLSGSKITLYCEAKGSPRPTITWKKNTGKISSTFHLKKWCLVVFFRRTFTANKICRPAMGLGANNELGGSSMVGCLEHTRCKIRFWTKANRQTPRAICQDRQAWTRPGMYRQVLE